MKNNKAQCYRPLENGREKTDRAKVILKYKFHDETKISLSEDSPSLKNTSPLKSFIMSSCSSKVKMRQPPLPE